MQRKKADIESSLVTKGFHLDIKGHHRYLKLHVNNKYTGVYTFLSQGAKPREYGRPLLGKMKHQLKLDTNEQLLDLIDCPMSEKAYQDILRNKGLL